ncbi:MAG: ECF-type riboflavin transporter substrate-binding protein [Sphaerochaetaceae bacterium]|jgi:energy-coupling factor transport system substrate-specific component|nr:ECF-type riboflavin transporter substrate-binding protein [Sphaerochaetaceae bacterium]MDD3163002.1 ECF-type riboflavin transporter substrate-binding protein [Sphaerochaetaceae bacterium]MDD4007262.1 ECF-type riboflavin transporter substrate-binding protein [Sphaerochaetaceae bacterium]MDD4396206.1 ECF-type riboflavin transporter substrate-binding protein [Sphaerochaetaceae bacterium]
MDKKKSMTAVKAVVVVAIGAALYGFGGLIGIPIFANTTIKPAMAILALFAGVYGPIVGALVGFLGHWITDLFAGWGVWFTWVAGSAICGALIGLYPIITKNALKEGKMNGKQIGIFIGLSFGANFIGYMISAILDYLLFAEPMDKVITQQLLVALVNTVVIAILGVLLMKLVASRFAKTRNLELDKTAEDAK